MWDNALAYGQRLYALLLDNLELIQIILFIVAVGTLASLSVKLLDWTGRRKRERAATMRKEKLAELRSFAADVLVNGIEDAIHEDKLSREDGNYLYRNFSHQLGIWDLYPRRLKPRAPNPTELKEQIKARINSGEYKHKVPEVTKPVDELEAMLLDGIKHAAM